MILRAIAALFLVGHRFWEASALTAGSEIDNACKTASYNDVRLGSLSNSIIRVMQLNSNIKVEGVGLMGG